LLAELARILQRIKFAKVITASGMTFDQLVLGYTGLTTLIAPAEISPTVLNDPDDDHVLACAVAAKADLIVSGDSDLLDLKAYQGIPIETPAEALRRICAA
jgi:putative PIN family toxin of toxin-antitoxin system